MGAEVGWAASHFISFMLLFRDLLALLVQRDDRERREPR